MASPSHEDEKRETFPWVSLPQELQTLVFERCDKSTLANLCGTNQAHRAQCFPILWHTFDFQAERRIVGAKALAKQRDFLLACDAILENPTERGRQALESVRVLRMINTPGLAVPYENTDNNSWIMFLSGGKRHLIEIIAALKGLEELQIYIKESLDHEASDRSKHMKMGSLITNQLPSLTKLVMGGEIPRPVVLALLSFPEKIQSLSCISLLDGTVGQHLHSGGLLFLYRFQERFSNLRKLHLCKLAELTEQVFPHETIQSGLRWNFDYENDEEVLEEWAELFEHICSTLEELELEHCYLVYHRLFDPARLVHAGADEPEEWGESASGRFQEIVLPAIAEQEWAKLRKIRLVGVMAKSTIEDTPLKEIESEIEIECLPARVMRFTDDATPIAISPPNGPFSHAVR